MLEVVAEQSLFARSAGGQRLIRHPHNSAAKLAPRVLRPNTNLTHVPDIASLQSSDWQRKTLVADFPHVDCVGFDTQSLGDLCWAYEKPRETT